MANKEKLIPNQWLCVFDTHSPYVDWKTLNALLDYMGRNKHKIAGFYFGGDQLDNEEISHHNRNKPIVKPTGSYERNTRIFDKRVLQPIEQNLPEDAVRVWQIGNHDDWENQFIAEHPELQGTIERTILLNLADRGWQVIPCGQGFRIGKLNLIHGETLSGIGNQTPQAHAKKAVEVYAGNVLFGHMHSPQTFTKILPYNKHDKWQATCSPILGAVNPAYLRNRPTAWLNGFTIVELLPGGNFNVYPIVVTNGKFSFAGEVYGG